MAGLGDGGRASAVGIELAIAVVGGLLLGGWLDGRFGTSPYLTLGGLVFGTVVGFRDIWRAAKRAQRED